MKTRRLQQQMQVHAMGQPPAFRADALRAEAAAIDPFLMTDHFWMSVPYFPPHPHAGFAAVTYMFEDSDGSFRNRDSLGDDSLINPGDLHWTHAGRGVIHEETPTERGIFCHGLQIFVNLAASQKFTPPRAQHLTAAQMPVVTTAKGVRVKVVAGNYGGQSSPLASPTAITMLDVQLSAAGEFVYEVPADWNVFVVQVRGNSRYGSEESVLQERAAAVFAHNAEPSHILAHGAGTPSHFYLFAGQPLREPLVVRGPFAMNTQTQIIETMMAYKRGEMGDLEPSF